MVGECRTAGPDGVVVCDQGRWQQTGGYEGEITTEPNALIRGALEGMATHREALITGLALARRQDIDAELAQVGAEMDRLRGRLKPHLAALSRELDMEITVDHLNEVYTKGSHLGRLDARIAELQMERTPTAIEAMATAVGRSLWTTAMEKAAAASDSTAAGVPAVA